MRTRLLFVFVLLAAAARAELRLNGLFTDNMVLQRDQPVPVWGTADPGDKVTIEFVGQKKETTVNASGDWNILLDPMKASSRPNELTVFQVSGFKLQVSNILIGDVWLCAGQSNMAQAMKRYLIWDQVKEGFENEQLRFFKIKEGGVGSPEPTKELVIDPVFTNSWQGCSPEFAAEFSATAGFFGMKLQRDLGVPIGLLYANRGGTHANMWMAREVLEANPDYARFLDASNNNWKPSKGNPDSIRAPSYLYNGTIHPLAPFAIRGAIWYQGESDSQWSELYNSLMTDLITSWREEWGYDFPFLFVQLAPYNRVDWDQVGEGWAWLRDAQLKTLDSVPKTGMAVITDGGEAQDIHPQAKNLPGERLAVLAASLDDPGVDAGFPTFGSMKVKNGQALLTFNHVSGGLETRRVAINVNKGLPPGSDPDAMVAEADELKGFTICGADHVFVEATAKIISKDGVAVSSPDVRTPVAARYGWANFPLCNLYGGNGMPASPFRTDDFPMPNLTGEKIGQPFQGIQPEWGAPMTIQGGGDGSFQTVELDGVTAQQADGMYLYFQVPEINEPMSVRVHVVYKDEGFAAIQLRYDSTDTEVFAGKIPGRWKPAGEVKHENSNQWKVAVFELPDARFSKGCNGGDIRLQGAVGLTLGGVYVQTDF